MNALATHSALSAMNEGADRQLGRQPALLPSRLRCASQESPVCPLLLTPRTRPATLTRPR